MITSVNSFKTCYIADVKEELGLLRRKAPNRDGKERKHKAPNRLKPFIKKAILSLQEDGENLTYKKIQEKALEIYKEHEQKKKDRLSRYYGVVRSGVPIENVVEIVEDSDFGYED